MKLINFFFTISLFLLISCDKKSDDLYYDVDLTIIAINANDTSLSNDKFHDPQLCDVVLFSGIFDGKKLYCEINTCDEYFRDIHIDNEWIYNHQPGDVVHFDYLRKDRFFPIKLR